MKVTLHINSHSFTGCRFVLSFDMPIGTEFILLTSFDATFNSDEVFGSVISTHAYFLIGPYLRVQISAFNFSDLFGCEIVHWTALPYLFFRMYVSE